MKLNLTLAQKAFVLVCVPLIFEIAFVGVLAQLLAQAEHERAQEAHAKDVQSQVNVMLGLIINAGAGLVISEFAKSKKIKERYNIVADRAKDEFATLKKLVRGHKDEEEAVNHIGDLHVQISKVLKHARQDSEDDNKIGLIKDFGTLQSLTAEFSAATGELTAKQREIERQRTRARVKARTAITNLMYLALLFNIGLAIGLALYFNRGTSSRMVILMDNTRRLAKGQSLNPPIGGRDEIAHLDRTFNEMAEALERAARKERAMTENAVDVICSLDKNLNFQKLNPASFKVWGYLPEELQGKSLQLLIPPEDFESLHESFASLREKVGNAPIESRLKKKDGSFTEMLWSVQWSREEEGYFCVAHDITERKEIEKMKRDFVAMVSHDLRTPLTSIQGFLSLLEAGAYGELSEAGNSSLNVADNSISRLIKLVNDLLDVEKIESGKFELQPQKVLVKEITGQALEAVADFARQNNVELSERESDASQLKINADSDRLIQVLVNLLSNAIKFSGAGSQVTVSTKDLGELLEFSVEDQGRGIPEIHLTSIFERFSQVKKSDAKNRKGAGLGLAICKAIIEKHGGKIGVESQEGKGSRFWFSVPKELS